MSTLMPDENSIGNIYCDVYVTIGIVRVHCKCLLEADLHTQHPIVTNEQRDGEGQQQKMYRRRVNNKSKSNV